MCSHRIVTLVVVGSALCFGLNSRASAQGTWRVSVPTPGGGGTTGSRGGQGDGYSFASADSSDGRFVAFESDATNLVGGDTNAHQDIFVRDRLRGLTTRVSVNSVGEEGNSTSGHPSISGDGRYVAFHSSAEKLVAGDTNRYEDVFVHDRQTASTTRVSVHTDGTQGDDDSSSPSISADGRFVAFHSFAENLVPGDTNGYSDVFVHDRSTATTVRVSLDSAGVEGDGYSMDASISADGRFVAFFSRAKNLIAQGTSGAEHVFVHDRQTATTTIVSVDSAGVQGDSNSWYPSISADGRFVAFTSYARNLVAGDTNWENDVFVHDRQTATTTRVSVDSAGVEGNHNSRNPMISGDGRFVAFTSKATNLVAGDTNGEYDVFVHDRQTASTTRASVDAAGRQGNDNSQHASISADGRFVSYWSFATNLVRRDTNGQVDVFVRGPYLSLSAESESVAAGEELNLTTWIGEPGGLVVLKIVEVNGTPVSVPFASGLFDPFGLWSIDGTVPFGVSGNTVTFRAVGITPIGTVEATNRETVTFQ